MVCKYIKRCLVLLVISKMYINIVRYYFIIMRLVIFKKFIMLSFVKDEGKERIFLYCFGNIN